MRHAVLTLDELAPGEVRAVAVDGTAIVVVRTPSGAVHALRDACAHMGARLSNGYLLQTIVGPDVHEYALEPDGYVLRCPWHGYEYDLHSGRCLAHADRVRVGVFPVTVEDGTVYVER